MSDHDAVVAVFADHASADAAIRKLAKAGLDMKHFSVVGKGYHTEESVVGFYNTGERVKFWGKNGAFWGAMWGLFFGGILFTIPVIGHVIVLGHLAAMIYGAVEGAVVVGGLSALGAALFSVGIPEDSVIQYEEAIKADGFLVVAQGSRDEMARAKEILASEQPTQIDLHEGVNAPAKSECEHGEHAHHAA